MTLQKMADEIRRLARQLQNGDEIYPTPGTIAFFVRVADSLDEIIELLGKLKLK